MPGMCLTLLPCIASTWLWSSTSPGCQGLFAWGPWLGAASPDQKSGLI